MAIGWLWCCCHVYDAMSRPGACPRDAGKVLDAGPAMPSSTPTREVTFSGMYLH
jgi:hypothetical protein